MKISNNVEIHHFNVLPRLIRLRDAPAYLGMDRYRFNDEVRPNITEVPIGSQGIAFDRLDLDAWVEDYKRCSGRPAVIKQRSLEQWNEKNRRVSSKEGTSGMSIRRSLDAEFEYRVCICLERNVFLI